MSAELIVVNGPLAGTRYDLCLGDIFVGRSTDAKVVLNEPEVSWRHCQIRRQGERFLVSDLRTSSGTYVNGTRSAERWLEDRDQIGVGKTILMFRSGAGEPEETTPWPPAPTMIKSASCKPRFYGLFPISFRLKRGMFS